MASPRFSGIGRCAQGTNNSAAHPGDCLELRFEDLVADPPRTLARIAAFIDHELDYAAILQNPVHALHNPNTSFRDEYARAQFNPVGRWKGQCSAADLRLCEMLVGPSLQRLGYPLAYPDAADRPAQPARVMRAIYPRYFSLKHALKAHTPLGRFMTSTRVWTEQPKPGEREVRPRPNETASC